MYLFKIDICSYKRYLCVKSKIFIQNKDISTENTDICILKWTQTNCHTENIPKQKILFQIQCLQKSKWCPFTSDVSYLMKPKLSQNLKTTSSPKDNGRSPESNVPRSICPKTLCSLYPTPMMLYIKFDQDWPTGFRDIQVQKCEIFVTQGQVTPKWVVWFGPKLNSTELLCLSWLPATLMMIRSEMNELAWRQHFPIVSLWEIF